MALGLVQAKFDKELKTNHAYFFHSHDFCRFEKLNFVVQDNPSQEFVNQDLSQLTFAALYIMNKYYVRQQFKIYELYMKVQIGVNGNYYQLFD